MYSIQRSEVRTAETRVFIRISFDRPNPGHEKSGGLGWPEARSAILPRQDHGGNGHHLQLYYRATVLKTRFCPRQKCDPVEYGGIPPEFQARSLGLDDGVQIVRGQPLLFQHIVIRPACGQHPTSGRLACRKNYRAYPVQYSGADRTCGRHH